MIRRCATVVAAVVLTFTGGGVSAADPGPDPVQLADTLVADEQAVRDARRQRTALSLILLDLDHFKNINDTYGHQAGDAVLKHCAATIQRCLRNADILCRWGGEEFLVVLKQCAAIDAFHLAEKIRQAIAKDKVPFREEGIQVRVSLGVAQLQADETGEALLTRADSAMYRAKESGRNRTKMSD